MCANYIGERLKKTMINLGFQTSSAFANKIGIIPQTYSRYEKGEREIPDELKIKLYKMKVDINWLLTGEGEMFSTGKELAPSVVKIPLLRQTVSCGPGQEWQGEDNIESYIEPSRRLLVEMCLVYFVEE